MKSVEKPFGNLPDGREVRLFTVRNDNGYELSVMNYGGIITSFKAPDRDGEVEEITLGYDTLDEYLGDHPFFGATVGRVANRIKSSGITVDGEYYELSPSPSHKVHLHGGAEGFDKKLWDAKVVSPTPTSGGVELDLVSPDGDQGYPGRLSVTVTITLNEENELTFEYRAETEAPTPVNLTNHTYWNLAGNGKVYDQEIILNSSTLVETDNLQLPTGRLIPVEDTAFDLRKKTRIGDTIEEVKRPAAKGYDDCYFLDGWELDTSEKELLTAAQVRDPASGRVLEVRTSYPGVQFYSGNNLPGERGRHGEELSGHEALCLETQYLPDSVHHPSFPDTILRPGEVYRHTTVHRYSTE